MANQVQRKGLLLKADAIAGPFHEEIKRAVASDSAHPPRIAAILSTSSAPSRFYADFAKKQCEELGVTFSLRKTGAALSPELGEGEGVEEAIIEANEDVCVTGILVFFPIFGAPTGPLFAAVQIVSPLKDVEGLNFKFHYNLYHNIRFIEPKSLLASTLPNPPSTDILSDEPPPGTVKSIIPCTPLAVVKCLEHIDVYNKILPYGDRAYGKTITVINRSEVVGRPLAALLSNDGARVFSIDIDSIQEYTKRPKVLPQSTVNSAEAQKYHPRHITHPCSLSLQECLAISDVVISAVPNATYKVKTEWLKDGCVCVNVAADKNFEKDVRDKASIYIPAVGKVTIFMLLRNLLRLQQYQV